MANLIRVETSDKEVWWINKDQIQYVHPCVTNNKRSVIVMKGGLITVDGDPDYVMTYVIGP